MRLGKINKGTRKIPKRDKLTKAVDASSWLFLSIRIYAIKDDAGIY